MTSHGEKDRLEFRDRLLLATLPHVVFDGWNQRALDAGARDIGVGSEMGKELFPAGFCDLALHFNDWADRAMLQSAGEELLEMPIRERIATLVRLRLQALGPHREAVRKVIAYLTLPGNALAAADVTYRTVNLIWYTAGDSATDFNFYTKRGLLLAVYSTTVLYWLADESDDFAASWGFLDRRLADVMNIPRLQRRLRGAVQLLPSPLRLMRPIFAR